MIQLPNKAHTFLALIAHFSRVYLFTALGVSLLSFLGIAQFPSIIIDTLLISSLVLFFSFHESFVWSNIHKHKAINQLALLLLAVSSIHFISVVSGSVANPLRFSDYLPTTSGIRYRTLVSDTVFSTSFTPTLNYLGSVDLSFGERQHDDLEEDLLTKENKFSTSDKEKYQVAIYADDELIHSYVYSIPVAENTFTYPVGFPTDPQSKGKTYRVEVSNADEFIPRLSVGMKDDTLFVNPQYVLTMKDALQHPDELFHSLVAQVTSIEVKGWAFVLAYFVLSVVWLYSTKFPDSLKTATYSLTTLALFYLLYMALKIGAQPPGFLLNSFGLWSLVSIPYALYLYRGANEKKVKVKTKINYIDVLFILGTTAVFLFFALNHLGEFLTVDEPKWLYTRVPQLYDSLQSFNLPGTYINDKPGIIPAFLSGIVNLFTAPTDFTSATMQNYLFLWRLPIVLFTAALIPMMYFGIVRALNREVAKLGTLMIVLFPQLVGISQIVNPDSTLWSLMFLSALFFLSYLRYDGERDVFLSGVFLGLALLSKFFGVTLYLVFFVLIGYEFLTQNISYQKFVTRLSSLTKVVGISMLVFWLLLPAAWVNPSLLLKTTVNSTIMTSSFVLLIPIILFVLADIFLFEHMLLQKLKNTKITSYTLSALSLVMLVIILFSCINMASGFIFYNWPEHRLTLARWSAYGWMNFLSSMNNLLFGLPNLVLVGAIGSNIILFAKKWRNRHEELALVSVLITWYTVLLGASLVGIQANIRYQIFLMPLLALSSAVVFAQIKINKILLLLVVGVISILSLVSNTPYYIQASNSFNTQNIVVLDSWGFGGYELAQKMNTLDNAPEITVWVDREGFLDFFIGKGFWRSRVNPYTIDKDIDYLILTKRGEQLFRSALQSESPSFYQQIANDLVKRDDYYNREPTFEVCVTFDDCYRAVKFEKPEPIK